MNNEEKIMSIVVVGSVALDTVETPRGRRENALGGSATYFSLASSRFSHTGLVGIAGRDFPESGLRLLKESGVDTEGLDIVSGKTFRWGGRYKANLNKRDTIFTELNVFEHFNPSLPESYRNCDILFLGNIHPELQLHVLNQVQDGALKVLDTMNLWIDISRDKLLEVIRRIDVIIINDDEIRQLTRMSNVYQAAEELLRMGPRTLILKKGEYGAVLFHENRMFLMPAYPVADPVDPTGAGDTFAGGFLGYLGSLKTIKSEDYRMAMVYGTVMASFLVESFSTDKLTAVTEDEIQQRISEMKDMISL